MGILQKDPISASTVDLLLAPERKKLQLKGRSGTKPGSLLKHKIPIRTFADWDNARPGFLPIRVGSKLIKQYDNPLTPYARAQMSKYISDESKESLKVLYATLNPAKLRRDILKLQEKLYKLAGSKYDLLKGQKVAEEHMAYAKAS